MYLKLNYATDSQIQFKESFLICESVAIYKSFNIKSFFNLVGKYLWHKSG